MIRYAFREPLTIKGAKNADPQIIGKALDAIEQERGGRITPKAVVETAKDEANPLHPFFEWDDAKAAEAYRLDQARVIIRSIQVKDEEGDQHPAYFSVNEKGGQSYRSYSDVMSSRDLQLAVLRSAKRDLDAWENRYRELVEICELIRPASRRLSERIDEGGRPAP